jgi:predicted phosphohydrolase
MSTLTQFKHKIVIAGNHDFFLSSMSPKEVQEKYLTSCTYLQDSSVTIEGLKIYGTPWVINPGVRVEAMLKNPKFAKVKPEMEMRYAAMYDNKNFYQDVEKLKSSFDKIPQDVDLLITHMPPATFGNFFHF